MPFPLSNKINFRRRTRPFTHLQQVWGSVYDIRELLDSTVKLMDGRSPLEMKLPMPLEALKKPILRKIDKTVIGKLLRDHGVLKDWMV